MRREPEFKSVTYTSGSGGRNGSGTVAPRTVGILNHIELRDGPRRLHSSPQSPRKMSSAADTSASQLPGRRGRRKSDVWEEDV